MSPVKENKTPNFHISKVLYKWCALIFTYFTCITLYLCWLSKWSWLGVGHRSRIVDLSYQLQWKASVLFHSLSDNSICSQSVSHQIKLRRYYQRVRTITKWVINIIASSSSHKFCNYIQYEISSTVVSRRPVSLSVGNLIFTIVRRDYRDLWNFSNLD